MNVPKGHSPSKEFLSSKMYCGGNTCPNGRNWISRSARSRGPAGSPRRQGTKRIYQGGEESDAAFFVYFADTVRLQQLVNASAFFVCQVVSGDVLYVEADGLL